MRNLIILVFVLLASITLAEPSQWGDNDWYKFFDATASIVSGEAYSRAPIFPEGVGGRFPLVDVYSALSGVSAAVKPAMLEWLKNKMVDATINDDMQRLDNYQAYYTCLATGDCSRLQTIQDATQAFLDERGQGADSGTSSALVNRSLVLLLDASGSMGDTLAGSSKTRLEDAKEKIVTRLRQLGSDVEVALIVFYGCGSIVIEQSFTTNAAQIETILPRIQPSGDTPLAEAISFANTYIQQWASGFPADLVLLSDGQETCNGDPEGAASELNN